MKNLNLKILLANAGVIALITPSSSIAGIESDDCCHQIVRKKTPQQEKEMLNQTYDEVQVEPSFLISLNGDGGCGIV